VLQRTCFGESHVLATYRPRADGAPGKDRSLALRRTGVSSHETLLFGHFVYKEYPRIDDYKAGASRRFF
jgi:hypothetical protein